MSPEVSVEHPGIALDSEPSMRCYFHLVNGEEIILDDTGIEGIRTEAIQLGASWQGWKLDIVDSTARTLLSITLDPTIH